MTCIVGLVQEGKVHIGGDSAGVAGLNIRERKDSKVFINKNFIFGFTSSFRMGNILRYSFSPPYHKPEIDDYQYLCTDWVDEIIRVFKDKGYAKVDSNKVSGGSFLVGYNGNLYSVDSDFQIGQSALPYDACGCGEDYALGAMKVITEEKPIEYPEKKIKIALQAAEKFSAGVCSPFNILSI